MNYLETYAHEEKVYERKQCWVLRRLTVHESVTKELEDVKPQD